MTGGQSAKGHELFAQYAYPPNELGYCGTGDGRDLLDYADPTASAPPALSSTDVAERARGFDGAWPYLEFLAAASGVSSALDARVVEAYWIGNELLTSIDQPSFIAAVRASFGDQHGADWGAIASGNSLDPLPHHSFHVFGIYPWVGILRRTGSAQALNVLDRCRIRWGRVESVDSDMVEVTSPPLSWDGTTITLAPVRSEQARITVDGRALTDTVGPGDWVALHWDWVCDRLTADQVERLQYFTARQLDITNRR